MKRYFIFINLQFYFPNFFFTRVDFNFGRLFLIKLILWNRRVLFFQRYPDNCPRRKLPSPPVRVRVWFRVNVRTRTGGQVSSGAIALEPFQNLIVFFFFFFLFDSIVDFFFLFFYEKILHAQKAPKSTRKHQKTLKAPKALKGTKTPRQKHKTQICE